MYLYHIQWGGTGCVCLNYCGSPVEEIECLAVCLTYTMFPAVILHVYVEILTGFLLEIVYCAACQTYTKVSCVCWNYNRILWAELPLVCLPAG